MMNDSFDSLYKEDINVDCGWLFGSKLDITVSFRERFKERYGAKANFVFIAGEKSPCELPQESPLYHAPLQQGPRNQDALIDKLWDQYNRREVKIMKAYLKHLAETIESKASINGENKVEDVYTKLSEWIRNSGYDKAQFNVYAGCSTCKCSPGFRLGKANSIKNVAMFITVR